MSKNKNNYKKIDPVADIKAPISNNEYTEEQVPDQDTEVQGIDLENTDMTEEVEVGTGEFENVEESRNEVYIENNVIEESDNYLENTTDTESEQTEKELNEPVEDIYKKNIDMPKDAAYENIVNIMSKGISVDEKIKLIVENTTPEYQQLVKVIEEYSEKMNTTSEFYIKGTPTEVAAETMKLNDIIISALSEEDIYTRTIKLDILTMMFKRHTLKSLTPLVFYRHINAANASEDTIQNHIYNMKVLYSIARADNIKEITKTIDFDRSDFKYGNVFKEYIINK